jgi:hypothetical protein
MKIFLLIIAAFCVCFILGIICHIWSRYKQFHEKKYFYSPKELRQFKLKKLKDILFFKEWFNKVKNGECYKTDYMRNIDFYSLTGEGVFYGCFPCSMDTDGDKVILHYDYFIENGKRRY